MGGKVIAGMPPIDAMSDAKAGTAAARNAAESRIFLIDPSQILSANTSREAEKFLLAWTRASGLSPRHGGNASRVHELFRRAPRGRDLAARGGRDHHRDGRDRRPDAAHGLGPFDHPMGSDRGRDPAAQ